MAIVIKKKITDTNIGNANNVYSILHIIPKMPNTHTSQNFKLGTGPYGLPVSISDYILLISNNIKHTLHFTNSMATTGSINLVHDIFEILPELKKILERMDYTDPTSLEQKFNQEWVLFHSKITKFVNFTVREYDNDVNNSEKYTSKFIKYDLD